MRRRTETDEEKREATVFAALKVAIGFDLFTKDGNLDLEGVREIGAKMDTVYTDGMTELDTIDAYITKYGK